ncbi:unnamed protein product [Chondrus crispus]|uniref:Uncharacterized protein n=1 Tax=Chondrus crispus TaxID=2769 RepID=R7QHW2_CHOCR|nr:unnamed protein product [Chondrus crispus]CDF37674.1 unnamed protein product [Chondrus crispus]|eukprot:XP_005717545.1 unnamed protein product [Chondrus crispus]
MTGIARCRDNAGFRRGARGLGLLYKARSTSRTIPHARQTHSYPSVHTSRPSEAQAPCKAWLSVYLLPSFSSHSSLFLPQLLTRSRSAEAPPGTGSLFTTALPPATSVVSYQTPVSCSRHSPA